MEKKNVENDVINNDKKKISKKRIALIVAGALLLTFVATILIDIFSPKEYSGFELYDVPDYSDVSVDVQFETEPIEAVYSDEFNKTYNYSEELVINCGGGELIAGLSYTVTEVTTNEFVDYISMTVVDVKTKSESNVMEGISFHCKEGASFVLEGKNGTVTITGESQELSPAVDAKKVYAYATQTYNQETGEKETLTCTISGSEDEVDCTELPVYEEIVEQVDKYKEEHSVKQIAEEVVITVKNNGDRSEKCFYELEEVDCSKLLLYDQLKKDAEKWIKD